MSNIAYIFPGQGSQSLGMLSDLASAYPVIQDTFDHTSDILGYDLWALIQADSKQQLNQTEYTQPALLTASIAMWRVADLCGLPKPQYVAGHSLGEYSALVVAGVLSFTDSVRLVQLRGRFMQGAVPVGEGGMAAVLGLDDQKVIEICAECSIRGDKNTLVQAANFNAPGQVVIAGQMQALENAITALKAVGARRAMSLPVSAPFHSEAMRPAAEKMSLELEQASLTAPKINIIQNVNAEIVLAPDEIQSNLVTQMYSAVHWTETIEQISKAGVEVIECGPGKVLSGLNKRIDKTLKSYPIHSLATANTAVKELIL